MKLLRFTLSLWVLSTLFLFAEEKSLDWVADYDVATKLAAEQNRRVFVLFTNSKTCAPCKIFKDNILMKQEFSDYAKKNLVMLLVDYAPYQEPGGKVTLKDIEEGKKVPKELWMNGRGPWPYLFVLSPTKEVLFSGPAPAQDRKTVQEYLKFLDGLKKG